MRDWWVYIIESEKDKFYTGITTDISRRFQEHSSGSRGAKYFRTDRPKKVVLRERYANRSQASIRESEIKKLSHKEKLSLIKRHKALG